VDQWILRISSSAWVHSRFRTGSKFNFGKTVVKCQCIKRWVSEPIVRRENAPVADIFRTRPLNITFRRSLETENLDAWNHLVLRVVQVHLRERTYIFRWSLKCDGNFFVSSMYQTLLDTNIVPHNSYLWKIKIPLKIKVFLWLLYREAILTKDNLVKRNWHGNEMCSFCNNHKTIQHLFFYCALAKFIWRVIQLAAWLPPPNNIRHMFGAWVLNMSSSNSNNLLWLSCNDVVFNKTLITSYG
jgi:hypothetical protein